MTPPFDLEAAAVHALEQAGFAAEFSPAAQSEAEHLHRQPPPFPKEIEDLRHLLWSSVDNAESRDLDQIEVAERLPDGDILLRVGIAEVDWLALKESAIDQYAAQNTSTLYTGIRVFPMLPEALSTNLTSLLPQQDRVALVLEMRVNPDGTLESKRATRALVRNHARLDYETIGPWLEGSAPVPSSLATVPGLTEQLQLQDETMERFLALRQRQGALNFETVETTPITQNGKVIGLKVNQKNRARLLIESFMVAVNTTVAELLFEQGQVAIQRIVRAPKRWDRIVELAQGVHDTLPTVPDPVALAAFLERRRAADPKRFPELSLAVVKLLGPGEYAVVDRGARSEGHFGLAVQGYTHSTAPNRRYVDLVTQRLLKALLSATSTPYTREELQALAAHCTERAQAANKVERHIRKTLAVEFLRPQIGQVFEGVVTGVKPKATFARLLDPPVEGCIVRGFEGLDVGDLVRLKLVKADPRTGFIDFIVA